MTNKLTIALVEKSQTLIESLYAGISNNHITKEMGLAALNELSQLQQQIHDNLNHSKNEQQ